MVAHLGIAQPSRRFDQALSTVCEVKGRAADDLEHVGGGGLLLQRFAQLVEQPRVLDRDHGLMREVGDQRDLLLGERAHLLAVDADRADQLFFLEHRHVEKGSRAPKFGGGDTQRFALGVDLLGLRVHDVNRLPRAGDATQAGSWGRVGSVHD